MVHARPGGWWLHPNEGSRAPNAHVVFDCESYRNQSPAGERHTFRLAIAMAVRRDRSEDPWRPRQEATFHDPQSLWEWVAGFAKRNGRTIVVAHNLAYDLRVSRALTILPAMGWTPKPPMLDRNRVLFKWAKGDRTLVMVDSFNWLPAPLHEIGARLGVAKGDLPADNADMATWLTYCRRDVEILFDAWMRLVDFVKRENLGVWRPTGAGQAMNAYRHRFMRHRMLVHDDQDARTAEREAAWAGRAEAWRHGVITDGPFAEWDYQLGYANIMRECFIPTIYRGKATNRSRWQRWWSNPRFAFLLRCTVTTEVPCVPCSHGGGILWPIGTFPTVLWGHEANLVLESGGRVDVQEAFIYDRQPALRDFAEWCIGYLSRSGTEADPICQLAVKHFTRSIVGKFGTRYRDWQLVGDDDNDTLRLWSVVDSSNPDAGNLLQLGRRIFQQGPYQESAQSIPQVLSWIQAEMRVRLWRAMTTAGLEHVIYCDTDGLITDGEGTNTLRLVGIHGLRVKRQWESLEVMGPRQLVLDGRIRASGIPSKGQWQDGNRWTAEAWEEMTTSIRHGDAGSVRVRPRTYTLSGSERRRMFLPGGFTASRRLPVPDAG